jgi:hypothetical protein
MLRRSFVKYALLGVLVALLASGFALRHKASAAAQLWLASAATSGLQLHDGDLIFQTSRSSQSLAKQRYGDAAPMDEPVISPVAMFNSPLLVQIAAK